VYPPIERLMECFMALLWAALLLSKRAWGPEGAIQISANNNKWFSAQTLKTWSYTIRNYTRQIGIKQGMPLLTTLRDHTLAFALLSAHWDKYLFFVQAFALGKENPCANTWTKSGSCPLGMAELGKYYTYLCIISHAIHPESNEINNNIATHNS
jgi:hypothetical protein